MVIGDGTSYCMMLMVTAPPSTENTMNAFKVCTLSDTLDGRQLRKEHMMQVIMELNDMVENKL